ncbi:MAG: hypothetical protein K2I82_01095, partial [Ruminococcus sp.]|nr:hypothetical protein [Ruminococcus sp.]
MTAVKSSKKNFFWTRYLNNLRGNSKNFIVNIVLELLGLPVLSVIAIIGFYYDNKDNMTAAEEAIQDAVMMGCIPFAILACCTLAVSILMGSMIALSQYSYLYKKTITDMNYSLPLSTTQRFFADYLSGFTIYIGIPLVSVTLSLGILGVGSIFVNMSDMWKEMPFILSLVFIVIIAMIQYYTMAIFSLSFCGNTFESHFSIIAFTLMIPATIGCLWGAITTGSAFGMTAEAILTKGIFTSTNPIGAATFFFRYGETYFDEDGTAVSMYAKWVAVILIVTALYLGGAYLLQRFRKAEDVSKPYVYRSFFYTIMTMGTFCVLSLFIMTELFIIAGIVICAVVWFIMEVITRRGFKKFWTAPVAFAAAVISVLGICWVCDITNGFGASKRVPSVMSISSVTIELEDLTGEYINGIKFRDNDVIKAAVELNKEIVDRHFKPDNYSYNTISEKFRDYRHNTDDAIIEFEYTTLTGSTTMRRYCINSGMADNLVKAIVLSDEYAVYSASQMGNLISTGIRDKNAGNKYNISIMDKLRLEHVDSKSTVTARQLDEIRNAYIKDMQAMTEDELLNGEIYCFIDGKWVLESFENTINALNVDIPEITSSSFAGRSIYVNFDTNPKIYTNVQACLEGENGINSYYYRNTD